MAARPRPRRSSPARCRTTAAPPISARRSFGKGSVQTIIPLGGRRRAAPDHGALLHAVGPLDPGPRHRAGHRGRSRTCRRNCRPGRIGPRGEASLKGHLDHRGRGKTERVRLARPTSRRIRRTTSSSTTPRPPARHAGQRRLPAGPEPPRASPTDHGAARRRRPARITSKRPVVHPAGLPVSGGQKPLTRRGPRRPPPSPRSLA